MSLGLLSLSNSDSSGRCISNSSSSLGSQVEASLSTSENDVPLRNGMFMDEDGPHDCKCNLCTSFGLRSLGKAKGRFDAFDGEVGDGELLGPDMVIATDTDYKKSTQGNSQRTQAGDYHFCNNQN
jgi:hypothetical protein